MYLSTSYTTKIMLGRTLFIVGIQKCTMAEQLWGIDSLVNFLENRFKTFGEKMH
jgi:hypothetical protein